MEMFYRMALTYNWSILKAVADIMELTFETLENMWDKEKMLFTCIFSVAITFFRNFHSENHKNSESPLEGLRPD